MPPVGRPPFSRGVYSIESPPLMLPEAVLVDTSFVVDALIASQRSHDACRAFLGRLLDDGSVLCFNSLLELELAETAFRLALVDRHGRRNWREARKDGRCRRRAARLMHDALDAWDEALAAFSYVRITLEEVEALAPRFMHRYGMKSYDAVHAATVVYVGAEAVVALDSDFAALPQSVPLYTTAGRIATCRERRPR